MTTIRSANLRYGPEAAMFFTAMGAVMFFQLVGNYSGNPDRIKSLLAQNLSVAGASSLYMFMQVNGVTKELAMAWFGRSAFRAFIPYLGMAAGYWAQSALSSFFADPNVRACAAQFLTPVQEPARVQASPEGGPCEAAFSLWAVKNRLAELCPGFVSIMTSTVLNIALRMGLRKAAEKGAEKFLDKGLVWLGIEVVLFLIPGGIEVSGFRFVASNLTSMTLFLGIDSLINSKITYGWKNVFDGQALSSLEEEITARLRAAKKSGWADECSDRDFILGQCPRQFFDVVKDFNRDMAAWRLLNLTDIYQTHIAWQGHVADLAGKYNATYAFYSILVDEIRNSKFRLDPPFRLELTDLLYGVTPQGLTAENMEYSYIRPNYTEKLSALTARQVGWHLERDLRAGIFSGRGLNSLQIELLSRIAKALKAEEIGAQAEGISLINAPFYSLETDGEFRTVLENLRAQLGFDPQVYAEPGRGFFARFEKVSSAGAELSGFTLPQTAGLYSTPYFTEHMLVDAVCGVDVEAGESVINDPWGWSASFSIPRITVGSEVRNLVCAPSPGTGEAYGEKELFTLPVRQGGKEYPSLLDFVMKNTNEKILGSADKPGFEDWWKATATEPLKKAFEGFAEDYEANVIKLAKVLLRDRDSRWNDGPIGNSPLTAVTQQLRVNLLILSELFKDLFQDQFKFPVGTELVEDQPESVPPSLRAETDSDGYADTTRSGLFSILRKTSSLDWENLIATNPQLAGGSVGGGVLRPAHALHAQAEIAQAVDGLIAMISRLQWVKINGKEHLRGNLQNSEVKTQMDLVEAKVAAFELLFDRSAFHEGELLALNPGGGHGGVKVRTLAQAQLIGEALAGVRQSAQELALFGIMTNSMNWDELNKLKALSETEQAFDKMVEDAKVKLRASLPGAAALPTK